MLLCAVHATQLDSMPDATACVPAVGAAAYSATPMTNLRMHLEQLALGRTAASAAAPTGLCTLLLLSPAPACALDLPGFLRLGAPRFQVSAAAPANREASLSRLARPRPRYCLQGSVWTCRQDPPKPSCSRVWRSLVRAAWMRMRACLRLMDVGVGRPCAAEYARHMACKPACRD